MSTTYGLTAAGFVPKPTDASKAELEADFKNVFGAEIDVSPSEPFGQIIGILAERETTLWDLAQAVYASQYPDTASGASLDDIGAITGTARLAPTRSLVTLTACGTAGTVIASGKVASVATAGTKFQTKAAATIGAVANWAALTVYALGARVKNGGNVYQATSASGTSAASGGPTTTGTAIVDGSVTWTYLGTGTGAIDIACESVDYGPKVAAARTLTTIETPVSGWSTAINLLDATPGRDLETDAAYRIRRQAELRVAGNAALEAIRADVLAVPGLTAVTVFENTSATTDGAGLPAHSIQVLAQYPGAPITATDNAIRAAIFASKAAGIETYGSHTGTVTDSQGIAHTIGFDYPTEKDVWITVNLTKDAAIWPVDGPAQVKQALVNYALAHYVVGTDVITTTLYAPIFGIAGVVDVTGILIGLVNPPVASTNIVIGTRELAVFDTSRIVVNVT